MLTIFSLHYSTYVLSSNFCSAYFYRNISGVWYIRKCYLYCIVIFKSDILFWSVGLGGRIAMQLSYIMCNNVVYVSLVILTKDGECKDYSKTEFKIGQAAMS